MVSRLEARHHLVPKFHRTKEKEEGVVPLLFLCYNIFKEITLMSARAKRLVKMLERLISKEHLYTDDQLKLMKSQLRVIKEELAENEAKQSKGFGK